MKVPTECPVAPNRVHYAIRIHPTDKFWWCAYCAAHPLPQPTREPWNGGPES